MRLPKSGTWDSGQLSEQPTSAPATAENGSSSSLLPTPTSSDAAGSRNATADRPGGNGNHHDGTTLTDVAYLDRFGEYTAAVERHADLVGRPAPDPLDDGRLSPAFVEWMQGLPAGHVTDTPVSRTAQLRALGNGVVPQQALAALEILDP